MISLKNLNGPVKENQYTDIEYIDRGGMALVFKGKDTETNKIIAIKLIQIKDSAEADLIESEMKIAVKLKHENILNTQHYEFLHLGDQKYIYSIMDFYKDGNLRKVISTNKNNSIEYCLNLMKQICSGLIYSHTKIIHRDLKPENILIEKNVIKIADFGLAKLVNSKTRSKSFKGSGTLPYMAPECWLYETNTTLMDIYSLGIIFFEILTGEQPFVGVTELEIRNHHLYSQIPDMYNFRNDIPPRLKDIIKKMTEKNPQLRYPSVDKILESLDNILSEESENDLSISSIIDTINMGIDKEEQLELRKEKELQSQIHSTKIIDLHKKELLNKFHERVILLNSKLERTQIDIKVREQAMRISFGRNALLVSFFEEFNLSKYSKEHKRKYINNTKNEIGIYDLENYKGSALIEESVVLAGEAFINIENNYNWGYNLNSPLRNQAAILP